METAPFEDRAVLVVSVRRAGSTALFTVTHTERVAAGDSTTKLSSDSAEVSAYIGEWLTAVEGDITGGRAAQ